MAEATAPIIETRRLSYHIPIRRGLVFPRRVGSLRAVDNVSLSVMPGETVSIVGESGAGKSSLSLLLAGLVEPTGGDLLFRGRSASRMTSEERRSLRQQVQIIFQNPFGSLNPGLRVGRSLELPLRNFGLGNGEERRRRVAELLRLVGLKPEHAHRYPHEFSGGQAQRLSIARSLAARPSFLVLDEAVSALDVSIQAQIINLLSDLQNRLKLAYLFVAHDLGVVHHISDRVGVMFHGQLVEFGPRDSVFALPRHPHTKALLAAALSVDNAKVLPRLSGVVRDNREEDGSVAGSGCPYRFRCPFRIELCAQVTPEPVDLGGGHHVTCHVAERSPSDWLAGDPVVPKISRSEQSKHAKNPGETAHAH